MRENFSQRAAKLAAAARALKPAPAPFHLAFVTDRIRGPDPARVAKALPAGAALVFRDYDDPKRAGRARTLRRITAERGILLFIGGDVLLAREVGADGVHLRADQLRLAAPDRIGLAVCASCHDGDELARAGAIGADIVLLGPVYQTMSHPGAPVLGVSRFKALAAAASVPVLAIGGVDETNAAALAGPNVAGFAAIGAFAPDRALSRNE